MDDEAGSKIFFPERGVGLLGIIMPEGGGGGICLFLLSYVNFELDPSPYNELQIVLDTVNRHLFLLHCIIITQVVLILY